MVGSQNSQIKWQFPEDPSLSYHRFFFKQNGFKMIDFAEATKHNWSKEACYIISSICYYNLATITIDQKSAVYLEEKRLEELEFIKMHKTYARAILYVEGKRFLEIPYKCCAAHQEMKKLLPPKRVF